MTALRPEAELLRQGVNRMTAADVAKALEVPVELLACGVEGCTAPDTLHHHHRALTRHRSPLACRCRHITAR